MNLPPCGLRSRGRARAIGSSGRGLPVMSGCRLAQRHGAPFFGDARVPSGAELPQFVKDALDAFLDPRSRGSFGAFATRLPSERGARCPAK